MYIREAIKFARESLQTELGLDFPDASGESNLLCQHILRVNRAWLIGHANDVLDTNQQLAFEALVKRRLTGEPIAYILGSREFYSLNFRTTSATLIPRADTEILVDVVLTKTPKNANLNILDLGTGSGVVALAIANNRPHCKITAVDFSISALNVALENSQHLKLTNVSFLESNWFSALQDQKFDVIVSNPPYIAQDDEHLQQGDLRFEPISALVSGPDGLDDIRKIIQDAPEHLNLNGWLMLEHGYDQASAVSDLLRLRGFTQIGHAKDISGTRRVTFGAI